MEQTEVYYLHIIIMHTFIQLHTPTHSYCSNMEVDAVEDRPKCTIYGPSIAPQRLSVSPGPPGSKIVVDLLFCAGYLPQFRVGL